MLPFNSKTRITQPNRCRIPPRFTSCRPIRIHIRCLIGHICVWIPMKIRRRDKRQCPNQILHIIYCNHTGYVLPSPLRMRPRIIKRVLEISAEATNVHTGAAPPIRPSKEHTVWHILDYRRHPRRQRPVDIF